MEATLTAISPTISPNKQPTPLHEQIQNALDQSPYICQNQVQVETSSGRVRLEGTVGTFYQKQMAQELVRRIDGVERVVNQLQVNWR